ncbi:MAG: sulfotransferase [Rhodospirillales bacterium]|nr:sulfotransferase [Rhodospirillales bacterium]
MVKPSRPPSGPMRLLEKALQDHRTGRLADAERGYREVLARDPEHPDALHLLGVLAGMAGDYARSIALIEKSLRRKPTADAHVHLGVSQASLSRAADAVASLEAAIRIDPRHALAHHHLGGALSQLGRRDEAIAAYRTAIGLKPDLAEAYSNLGLISTWREDDPAAKELLRLAERAESLPAASRIHLSYALGKYYDDIDDPDRAFACWREGARLKRAALHYDPEHEEQKMAAIAASFPPGEWAEDLNHGDPSVLPVFILGMPRSGTTLVEQILASHPQVHGAGEIGLLPMVLKGLQIRPDLLVFDAIRTGPFAEKLRRRGADYVARLSALGPQAQRITDKRPHNFTLVGAIHLILPRAAIVFCRRDLRDVGLSCYQTLFMQGHAWSYDLTELGRYAAAFARLMRHWRRILPGRILELDYEALVAEPEVQARRLVAHCGLDWDERCLDFHLAERAVRTASIGQVRQPIYRRSVGRWRRFERHLAPLVEALGDAAPGDGARPST